MRIAFIDFTHHKTVPLKLTTLQSDIPFLRGEAAPSKTIAEMAADDHLIIIASDQIYFLNTAKFPCKISLILAEPPAIHGKYYLYLKLFGAKFHRILTHNTWLLKACPNARFLAFGTTWITDIERDYSAKTKNISLVASKKWKAGGHRLRHSVVRAIHKNSLDVDVMGRGYKPFDDKADALAAYRFSIVIENSRTGGYFTEKLLDSLICLAVPIYWGAPDITHFFDPRGMIICHSKAEIVAASTLVDDQDYNKRLPYLIENKRRALAFQDYNERIGKALETDIRFSIGNSAIKA